MVEVDVFYDRTRKELLTSTTEASKRLDGDRHVKGGTVADSRIHPHQVKFTLYTCACTATMKDSNLYNRKKMVGTRWTPVIRSHNTQ